MHKLLDKKKKYEKENYLDMCKRYSGFGESFFEELRIRHPEVFKNLEFYNTLNSKYSDAIAIYDKEISFAIMLDSYCEAIFIWNKNSKFDFSESDKDPIEEGLKTIENYYLELIKEKTIYKESTN